MAGTGLSKVERAKAHVARVRHKMDQGVAVAAGTASAVTTGSLVAVGEHYMNKMAPNAEKVPLKPIAGVILHGIGAFTKGGGALNRSFHSAGDTCLGVGSYNAVKQHLEATTGEE